MSLGLFTRYGLTRVVAGGVQEEFTGIVSATRAATTTFVGETRSGWEFTVGASNLTVNMLRVIDPNGNDRRLRLHRVSDGAVMASVDATGLVAQAWNEYAVSEVTLEAGVKYTISSRAIINTSIYRTWSDIVFYSGVTFERYVFGAVEDESLPANTSSFAYIYVDFGYVAP